jgi:putative SOS response-associated peptidase YedK
MYERIISHRGRRIKDLFIRDWQGKRCLVTYASGYAKSKMQKANPSSKTGYNVHSRNGMIFFVAIIAL